MSFIYDDKKLINDLLKSAIDFENRFLKKGQKPVPNEAAEDKGVADADKARIALDFLDDIEKTVTGEVGNITTGRDGGTQLTPLSMESLGALVQFLADSQMMIDYKRIAYHAQENPPDKNNYVLYNLEGNTLFEMQTGAGPRGQEIITKGYYVNKNLLIMYLKSLQEEAHKTQNELISMQVNTLINEANQQMNAKIGPYKPPAKPGEKPEQKTGPGGLTAEQANNLNNLIKELPLDRDDIDFNRIKNSFEYIKNILAGSTNQLAAAMLTQIKNVEYFLDSTADLTVSGYGTVLSTTDSYIAVSNALKDKRSYATFVTNLEPIISRTSNIVLQLLSMYRVAFASNPSAKEAILGQDAHKNSNMSTISGWKSHIQDVTKIAT